MPRALAAGCALALLPLAVLAATPTPAKPAAPAEDSTWVFQLLPKSLQKNPRLDVTILSEMTDAGRQRPPVDPAHPAYYVIQPGGYQARNGEVAGERKVAPEDIDAFVRRSLANGGFLAADEKNGRRPTLVLTYVWGVHGEPVDSEMMAPAELDKNLRERATLVGGEKFARKLLDLVTRNRELMDAQSSGLRIDIGEGQAAPPPVGAELFAFMNPIERYRAENPKNARLLEQVRGDVYFAVVSAYDYDQLAAGQRVLLWRTRMTAGADGVSQQQALPTLVRAASLYFGKDMPEVTTIMPHANGEGRTTLGPIETIGYEEAAKPAEPKK